MKTGKRASYADTEYMQKWLESGEVFIKRAQQLICHGYGGQHFIDFFCQDCNELVCGYPFYALTFCETEKKMLEIKTYATIVV